MRTEAGFESTDLLSSGAVSSVWRAHHAARSGEFVIKQYHPDAALMGESQARSLLVACEMRARLLEKLTAARAEHWVRVHEVMVSPEQVTYVCDYHPMTLKRLVEMRIKLRPAALHQLVSGIVMALRQLQRIARRSHGNLKASNILLTLGPGEIRNVALTDPHGPSGAGLDDRYELGRLICIAVLRREIDPAENWPIPHSSEWADLGSKATAWRELCNRLLHPNGYYTADDLDKIDNEVALLAPEAPQRKLLLAVAAVAVLIAVVAFGFYFLHDRHKPAVATAPPQPEVVTPPQPLQHPVTTPPAPPTTLTAAPPPPPPVEPLPPATNTTSDLADTPPVITAVPTTTQAQLEAVVDAPPSSSLPSLTTKVITPIDTPAASADPRSIVFVCDASGSMLGLPFELIQAELRKAIDLLNPTQSFNVIFFRNGEAVSLATAPIVANPANKQKAKQFVSAAEVAGVSNPIRSLRQAFAQSPQLLYLLADGAFEDNDAVIQDIRSLNASKKTEIRTIALFWPDVSPAVRQRGEAVLRTIAQENRGIFKTVQTTDLVAQPQPDRIVSTAPVAPPAAPQLPPPLAAEPPPSTTQVALAPPPQTESAIDLPAAPQPDPIAAPAPPVALPDIFPPLPPIQPEPPPTAPTIVEPAAPTSPSPPPAAPASAKPVLLTSSKDPRNPADRYASVVFVCDGSGVMRGEGFQRLQDELRRAIDDLQPDQSFAIIVFRDQWNQKPLVHLTGKKSGLLGGADLLRATDGNKQLAKQFIDGLQPGQKTPDENAQEAMSLAFRLEPELIFIVTGHTLSSKQIGQDIRQYAKLDKNGKLATIHTVGLFSTKLPSRTRSKAQQALQSIAQQGSGRFIAANPE